MRIKEDINGKNTKCVQHIKIIQNRAPSQEYHFISFFFLSKWYIAYQIKVQNLIFSFVLNIVLFIMKMPTWYP